MARLKLGLDVWECSCGAVIAMGRLCGCGGKTPVSARRKKRSKRQSGSLEEPESFSKVFVLKRKTDNMDDKRKDVFSILLIELEKAERKHPEYPAEPSEALAIISEEMLELTRAVNDGEKKQRLIEEAAHVAVTAFRFIEKNI